MSQPNVFHDTWPHPLRRARCLVLVESSDCIPPHGLDLESERDYAKVDMLAGAFETEGFDVNMPALVGYPSGDGRIQLLTGTHRHHAAMLAGIKLPVTLWLRSDIEATWGTDLWPEVIKDIPVAQLLSFAINDGFRISPYERVQL